MNAKLFEKSISLRKSHIFGGKGDVTYKECYSKLIREDGCTVETTNLYDDNNKLLSSCDTITCP